MKHSFRTADFEQLAHAWNGFYPEPYHIDAELLRQKTVESPVFDWGASIIEVADGEVLGYAILKKSAHAFYPADRDVVHLGALVYREPQFGIDLMADVKRLLRNRGVAKIRFGQDLDHFFPGCPLDCPAVPAFLMVEGFEPEEDVVDLERDLTDYANPYPDVPGAEVRRLTVEDIPGLEAFFAREFPGRWRHDVFQQVDRQGPHSVVGLILDDQIEGMALIQDARQHAPIGGAVWRKGLGSNWGALGPIGVSARLRGSGYGGALLGHALAELKQAGVQRCIIDWTGLVEFYGKFGFKPTRRYRSMALRLEG